MFIVHIELNLQNLQKLMNIYNEAVVETVHKEITGTVAIALAVGDGQHKDNISQLGWP